LENFFKSIKKVLRSKKIEEKFDLFDTLYTNFLNDSISLEYFEEAEVFQTPSFDKLVTIVHPNNVKHRRNLHEDKGKIALLHAVAHIEYSAVDLALDACYRFQNMPKEFYLDWLEVADDEIRHFKMLRSLLNEYGVDYGALEVHQGLFDASMKSLTLIKRMAFIPRYMEANGLDSNQAIIKKLKSIPHTQKIVEALEIILEEEVDHVKKGDIWYKYGCNQKEGLSCDYFDIVNSIYPNSFKTNKALNVQARLKAGFSEEEIKKLQSI
jgi:uncharacterized ferritin-like protein (DUF455 family)